MPARKLLVARIDVRRIADDQRRLVEAMMMSCRCTRLTAPGAGFGASLREARRRQRYRPEDRSGEESGERYFHTRGKAHGWLRRGPTALDRLHTPCAAAQAMRQGDHPQPARSQPRIVPQ